MKCSNTYCMDSCIRVVKLLHCHHFKMLYSLVAFLRWFGDLVCILAKYCAKKQIVVTNLSSILID